MKRFVRAVVLGAIAGTIDVLPMVPMKSSSWAMASAFSHWLVLGVLIAYVESSLRPWLKGGLLSLASAVPVLLMVCPGDPSALVPITVTSALLGAGVGYLSGRLN